MQPISSLQNPRIKQIRALRSRRQRDESQLCYVDGVQLVAAAAHHRAAIELLVVAPELLRRIMIDEWKRMRERYAVV